MYIKDIYYNCPSLDREWELRSIVMQLISISQKQNRLSDACCNLKEHNSIASGDHDNPIKSSIGLWVS